MLRAMAVTVEADKAEEMTKLICELWNSGWSGNRQSGTTIRVWLDPRLGQTEEVLQAILEEVSQ